MAELTEGEVKNLFDEFKRILTQGGEFSEEPLNTMIERTSGSPEVNDFLKNLRDAAKNTAKNTASISDYLFAMYKSDGMQPAEGEGGLLRSFYKFVEEKLNGLMGESSEAYNKKNLENKNDEEVWELIMWSAELWFLCNLQKCGHDSVGRFIKSNAKELFHEFFDPRAKKNEPRFDVLAENDCVDIMKTLLRPELGVTSFLQKYFDEKGNVSWFCQTPMSQDMIRIVKPHSKKFYIIPRPSEEKDFAKMYALHASGFFKESQEGATASPSDFYPSFSEQDDRAAKRMKKALKRVGVEPIEINIAGLESSEVFPELESRIKDELDKMEHCSLFILSIFCCGVYGYLFHGTDVDLNNKKIEDLLQILQDHANLQDIPKVCNTYSI